MISIEIDEDVLAYLQTRAKPFVDTPNGTLRRVLGIDTRTPEPLQITLPEVNLPKIPDVPLQGIAGRTKAPKADLMMLIETGGLKEGQKLYLVNYQKNKVKDYCATIMGRNLDFGGKKYSMSALARELLQKEGFKSDDIRGPSHWSTAGGQTVTDLWQHILGKLK